MVLLPFLLLLLFHVNGVDFLQCHKAVSYTHLDVYKRQVLRTVLARDWNELAILGAVIALRGALTVLLHWEIKNERQEGRLAPDVRTKHE